MTDRPSGSRAAALPASLLALALLAGGCRTTQRVADSTALAAASAAAAGQATAAVRAIGEAAALAIAGRQEEDPEKLVAAAELLRDVPSGEGLFPGQAADHQAPGPLSPAALLLEAESMGPLDAPLEARIAAVRADPAESRPAGAERGPQRYSASVRGGAMRRHELYFEGPAPAVIQVRGSGATDLDVILLDVNGEQVAADTGPSDVATVHWYVPYTQTLTLVVRNRGPRVNGYYVITN